MKPKARNLILDLLLAAEGRALSVRDAITACTLFGISENNVRVSLARLSADGLIEAADRGSYQLSDSAHGLADDVATWRTTEQRVRDWRGGYIAVHCGALGRSDRAVLKKRDRALSMLGFRELERGLHVRPDNIEDSVEAVRKRLYTLGLDRAAIIFIATEFDPRRNAQISRLWDGKALTASYCKLRAQLETWMERCARLEPEVAARESFLLGGKAIRQIVFDPLLPAPMVDVDARHAFVEGVRRFDQVGQAIWRRLYESARRTSAFGPGTGAGTVRARAAIRSH